MLTLNFPKIRVFKLQSLHFSTKNFWREDFPTSQNLGGYLRPRRHRLPSSTRLPPCPSWSSAPLRPTKKSKTPSVRRSHCGGRNLNVLRQDWGAEIETPIEGVRGGLGKGLRLPIRLCSLWERSKLRGGVRGGAPAEHGFYCIFEEVRKMPSGTPFSVGQHRHVEPSTASCARPRKCRKQEIWANAHETRHSISLISYAGCLGLSPVYISENSL